MEKSIASTEVTTAQNGIRELDFAEILLIGAAGGVEDFPVIPR
ncbi:MAG: hypothetical protein ABIZ64_07190 [Casimicrobium sp.]